MVVGKLCRNFKKLSHMREMDAEAFTCPCPAGFLHSYVGPLHPTPSKGMLPPTVGWSSHISSLRHLHTGMPIGQSNADSPSLRLFFQVILGWVKLAIKASHHKYQRSPEHLEGIHTDILPCVVHKWMKSLASCLCWLCWVLLISTPPHCSFSLCSVFLSPSLHLTCQHISDTEVTCNWKYKLEGRSLRLFLNVLWQMQFHLLRALSHSRLAPPKFSPDFLQIK